MDDYFGITIFTQNLILKKQDNNKNNVINSAVTFQTLLNSKCVLFKMKLRVSKSIEQSDKKKEYFTEKMQANADTEHREP